MTHKNAIAEDGKPGAFAHSPLSNLQFISKLKPIINPNVSVWFGYT